MNNKLFVFASVLFLALSVSFVLAQEVAPLMVEDPIVSVAPVLIEDPTIVSVAPVLIEPVEDMAILLTTPANGQVYTFPATADMNAMNINFGFTVEPVTPASVGADCKVNVEGTTDFVVDAQVLDTGAGSVSLSLGVGTYSWKVECIKDGIVFTSATTNSFEVKVENNGGSSTGGSSTGGSGSGSGSSGNNEDSNRRRLQPVSLPLQELGNTAEGSEDQESSPGITGAVIGAFGKKAWTGIIILAVVLGVAGLVIYNRRKLGVVKAK